MRLQDPPLNFFKFEIFAYIAILLTLFLCFQHTDLVHTFFSSYAYLNGHFSDFYDYNKTHIGGNDYLPLIYVIFALWNIPLHFMGLLTPLDFMGPSRLMLEIFWSKTLLVFFFFASARLLSLITKKIIQDEVRLIYKPVAILFASSPMAVLIVFAFGQYDIIGVFFVLLGFYFYLKKNLLAFSLSFAAAISFKYFALVIYIPLLLMVEKNPFKILKWLTVCLSPVFLQFLVYAHSDIFLGEIFTLLKGKVVGSNQDRISFIKPTIYMAALYSVGCLYLYNKKYGSTYEWQRDAVLVPIAAYGLIFSAVVWHPQWLIIVMPFFALSYLYISNTKLLAFADALGAIMLVWICVVVWASNVDMNMIQKSILAQYLPPASHMGGEFLARNPLRILGVLIHLYLFSPVLLYLAENYSQKFRRETELSRTVLLARFFMGTGFFLLLAVICEFWL